MSSAVVSTSAALGRLFVFDDEAELEVCSLSNANRASLDSTARRHMGPYSTIKNHLSTISSIGNLKSANFIVPASRLEIRPAPEMVSSGIPALDALTGGLPRGCVTEICGSASSGRTTLLLAALAAATRRGEYCVLVDASDALDPQSAAASRVELQCLLWVRCGEDSPQEKRSPQRHSSTSLWAGSGTEKNSFRDNNSSSANRSQNRLEQALRATDLLLESGGFGMIALDLADLPPQAARRIPLTTWFRFRRAIEHTSTILLAIEQQPIAGSCSSLLLQLGVPSTRYPVPSSQPTHSHLLTGLEITAELIRSRLERKPVRSVTFAAKTAWAG